MKTMEMRVLESMKGSVLCEGEVVVKMSLEAVTPEFWMCQDGYSECEAPVWMSRIAVRTEGGDVTGWNIPLDENGCLWSEYCEVEMGCSGPGFNGDVSELEECLDWVDELSDEMSRCCRLWY